MGSTLCSATRAVRTRSTGWFGLAEENTRGDFVVVTIPLKSYRSVPVEPLAGKVVSDTR